MSDRRDYYFRQLVTESELDQGFDGLENADRAIVKDAGLFGVTTAAVAQNGTPDLSVNVQDLLSFDKDGQRVAASGVNNVNMALDFTGTSTAVASGGNEKILSLFVQFERALSDPRLDGNNDTVFFVRNESFLFVVKQGAESLPPATPVPVEADKLLIADVTLVFNQTQILDADIDISRQERLIADSSLGDTIREAITNLGTQSSAALLKGLDDIYRRSSTSSGGNPDTAGDGATVLRDGKAFTINLPNTGSHTTTRAEDAWNAAFVVSPTNFDKTGDDKVSGGDFGMVAFSGFRETADANELSSGNSISGVVGTFIPRDIQASTLSGNAVRTRIGKGAAATLNPTGGGDSSLCRLTGDDFFATASNTTALRRQDVLLVTFADGTQQAYRIGWVNGGAEKDAPLFSMGREPAVFATDTLVTVQWFSALFEAGSYPWETGDNESFGMGYYAPMRLQEGGSASNDGRGPRFFGRSFYLPTDPAIGPDAVMQFGYTNNNADEFLALSVLADGSIISIEQGTGQYTSRNTGYLRHALAHRMLEGSGGDADETFRVDPANASHDGTAGDNGAGYSAIAFSPGGAPDAPITVTVVTDTTHLQPGMEFEFIYNHASGLDVTFAWDPEFRFSDPSDAQLGPLNGSGGSGAVIRWKGIYYNSQWLMERVDYP